MHASTPGWTNAQRAALRPVALRPAPRHAALHDVKASSPTAWRAAKDAVVRGGVRITQAEDAGSVLTLGGRVAAPPGSELAQHPHHSAPVTEPGRMVVVEVALDASSGEILDARSGCCPGGFHPVLGSFCPCVGALVLSAAAASRSDEGLAGSLTTGGELEPQLVRFGGCCSP